MEFLVVARLGGLPWKFVTINNINDKRIILSGDTYGKYNVSNLYTCYIYLCLFNDCRWLDKKKRYKKNNKSKQRIKIVFE